MKKLILSCLLFLYSLTISATMNSNNACSKNLELLIGKSLSMTNNDLKKVDFKLGKLIQNADTNLKQYSLKDLKLSLPFQQTTGLLKTVETSYLTDQENKTICVFVWQNDGIDSITSIVGIEAQKDGSSVIKLQYNVSDKTDEDGNILYRPVVANLSIK